MDLRETIRIAWQELMANKLRSFLTLLGIIVGVGAVIGLLAVGNGAVAMLSGQFQAVGTNMVFIQWNWQEEDEVWENLGEEDLVAIEKRADLVTNVTPYDQGYGPVRAGRETLFVNISGVGENFPQVQGLKLARGRFFNAFEARTGKKVCVLGWDLHEKLFGNLDGVGRSIRVRGEKFKVLGVMEKKDDRSFVRTGITDNMRLYMPIRTLQRSANRKGYPLVMANPVEVRLTRAAVGQLKWILALLHGPRHKFLVQSMEEIVARELNRLRLFSVFLGGLGGISLLVGGIGIMNIMLVSVKERTKEIGIRKAVGAKERDLLVQFLIEAVLLCLVGGMMGIGLGSLVALAIRGATMVPAAVSFAAVLLGLGSALAVGLFFGIYPAWKAARLDPIVCLREE